MSLPAAVAAGIPPVAVVAGIPPVPVVAERGGLSAAQAPSGQ